MINLWILLFGLNMFIANTNASLSNTTVPAIKQKILLIKDEEKAALDIIVALSLENANTTENDISRIETIQEFFDHLFLCSVADNPQLLTSLGLFESIGIREHNAYLNNLLPEGHIKSFEQQQKNLKLINTFDVTKIPQEHVVSYEIFLWHLEHQVSGRKFIFHEYFVNQMRGVLIDLASLLIRYQAINTEEDVVHYLERLNKISDQCEQLLALLEYQQALGITVPAFIIPKIINYLDRMLPEKATDHIFYTHLKKKLVSLNFKDMQDSLNCAEKIIESKIYPAYQKIKDYYKQTMNDGTNHMHGVWALPDGQEYYQHMLKYHTTTNFTPEEVYALGLKEVAGIQSQIREILFSEGFKNAFTQPIIELLDEAINSRPSDYSNDETGRAKCLADYQAIIERARIQLYPLFNLRPKSALKLEAVPKYDEEGKPAAYYARPSMDGTRPGIFFVNLRNMEEVRVSGMETLTVHEAEPGHHFQIALQQEIDMPIMRKISGGTAFIEGWALYVEKLAYEQNFYSTALSKVGHLQDELLRAVRLVVDTGIHHKKWSREQAIEYMKANTGMHLDSVITEIERYFVMPGQACAYKIGQLKILELRDKAKTVLQEKFDIREFHDVVLMLGAAPLTVLEEVINVYVQKKLSHS